MTRTRHAGPGRQLRSTLAAVVLTGAVAGVALLHAALPAAAETAFDPASTQSSFVALPDFGAIEVPITVPSATGGETPLTFGEAMSAAAFVTETDPGAIGASWALPASLDPSELETLLAGVEGAGTAATFGSTSSFGTAEMAASGFGG